MSVVRLIIVGKPHTITRQLLDALSDTQLKELVKFMGTHPVLRQTHPYLNLFEVD